MDVGVVEGDSFRSGSRRRSVLAAHGATCDMFIFGADRKLRVYNPKVGTDRKLRDNSKASADRKLREVQRLQPQLLDNEFIQATPGFFNESLSRPGLALELGMGA